MQKLVLPLGACLLVLIGATEASAQTEVGRYRISANLGIQTFAESSALETSAVGAVDVSYYLTSSVALGLFAQVARPKTDPTFFPLVRLDFGTETEFHQPAQRMTSYVVGLQGQLSRAVGQIEPHVIAGIGYYAFTLDPQQNRSDESRDGFSLNLGLGASYALSEAAGVRVEIRDMVFLDYDRDWFNLSDPLLAEPRFPEPGGVPPDKQSTIHNLRFSLGFTYTPGAGR
ncbi:MAG: hypothetical protein AMS25_08090 [Gemmatimonas sp. SM23_52]|nr:MAG: hypothetical protein AMS25_08090 [Gemmatimonas sp. SM23_52]